MRFIQNASLLLLLSLLLAACGEQPIQLAPGATFSPPPASSPDPTLTLVPSDTPTATASPLPSITPTPSATPVFPNLTTPGIFRLATPTFIATPAVGWSAFQLKTWTEPDALDLIRQVDEYAHAADTPGACLSRPAYATAQPAVLLAVQETLLRFPDSPHAWELRWKEALAETMIQPKEAESWIVKGLEQGLNDGRFLPDDLSSGLTPLGFHLVPLTEGASEVTLVPNLLGDMRTARVIELQTLESRAGGFILAILQGDQGAYQVLPVYDGFDFLTGGPLEVQIADRTHDGLPEIIVTRQTCACQCKNDRLIIFQWRDGLFLDLTRGKILFNDPTASWNFGPPEANGADTIETVSRGGGSSKSTARYAWDGKWYQLAGRSFATTNPAGVEMVARRAAFAALVASFSPEQSLNAAAALRKAGVNVIYSAILDVNGDGKPDWVVSINQAPAQPETDLWALVNTGQGLRAAPVVEDALSAMPDPLQARRFFRAERAQLKGEDLPLVLLQSGDHLYLFQVRPGANGPLVEALLLESYVQSFDYAQIPQGFGLRIFHYNNRYQAVYVPDWEIFVWEPTTGQLTQADRTKTFAEVANARLLAGDAFSAIPALNNAIALTYQVTPNYCTDGLLCPGKAELLYRLGLAYDLSGNAPTALQTYWRVWQDYPDTPYGLMARARLAPSAP